MKNIGMVVAVEIQAVLDRYGAQLEELSFPGYRVKKYRTERYNLFVLDCGAGEIAAAAGTQFLISQFAVDLVVNFGVVGGLTEEMHLAKTCIIERVVHYDFDTSALDHCEVGRYLNYPSIYIPASPELVRRAIMDCGSPGVSISRFWMRMIFLTRICWKRLLKKRKPSRRSWWSLKRISTTKKWAYLRLAYMDCGKICCRSTGHSQP